MTEFNSKLFNREPYYNLSFRDKLIAIKAEFENEGTSSYELAILSKFCKKNKFPLNLKIGGPKAKNDIYEAFHTGVQNIIAPMIETKISLKNIIDIYNNVLEIYSDTDIKPSIIINIESFLAYQKLDEIIEFIKTSDTKIKGIVIGRKDLSKSMSEKDSNSERILKIALSILERAKKYNINVTVGGNITYKSYHFISSLSKEGLKSFETRKCVFSIDNNISKKAFKEFVKFGLYFELEWLRFKKELYKYQSKKEDQRIESILSRIEF